MLELVRVRLERKSRLILDDVNLAVHSGGVHGILGQNGTGKSSPAYTIMGLPEYLPDSGTVRFDKKDITHASITERTLAGTPLHHAGIDARFVVANQLLATEHCRNDYFRNRLSPRPSFGDDPALRQ